MDLIKHNKYFDGKVPKLGFNNELANMTIFGIMETGESTNFQQNCMKKWKLFSGTLEVKIPGGRIIEVKDGQHFEVEAKQVF